ncbi:MAG TPA: hypothetical protein VFM48_07680 [Aquabacterium sp.]|nr:hypothetical protein [Aquabacterium sp.]
MISASRTRVLFGLAWLAVLTLADRRLGGCLKSSLLYIVPVAVVAYDGLNLAIVFAGLAALSAWIGGAIPSNHASDPVWVEGLWAFTKLSIAAVIARNVFSSRDASADHSPH